MVTYAINSPYKIESIFGRMFVVLIKVTGGADGAVFLIGACLCYIHVAYCAVSGMDIYKAIVHFMLPGKPMFMVRVKAGGALVIVPESMALQFALRTIPV